MKTPPRLWIWLGVALVGLVALTAVLQAVNNLLWQMSYLLPSWLVGPAALLLFGGGTLLLARLAWPWFVAWRKGERSGEGTAPALPPPPGNRQEAAQRNLDSIDKLLSRIRDDVQRQALQQERERVAAELQRGDLVVVVFGTGSAGKTSLIRALLREVVGQVGAAMGSTAECVSYRLRLKDLQRGLRLWTPRASSRPAAMAGPGNRWPASRPPTPTCFCWWWMAICGPRNRRCSRPWPNWASG